jgi:hypothetical protein
MSEIEVAVTQSTRAPRAAKSKVAVPSPVAESDDEDDEMEVDEDDDEEEDEDEDGEEEDFRPNKSKATPKKTPVKKPIRGKESVKSKPVPDAKAKGQRKPSTKKNKTKVTLVEHGDMEIADDNGLFSELYRLFSGTCMLREVFQMPFSTPKHQYNRRWRTGCWHSRQRAVQTRTIGKRKRRIWLNWWRLFGEQVFVDCGYLWRPTHRLLTIDMWIEQ